MPLVQAYPACMSYVRVPPASSAAPRAAEAALSANAQAWRRLATVGYHRTAEMVRATQPASLVREPDPATESPTTGDAHQSGFQSL